MIKIKKIFPDQESGFHDDLLKQSKANHASWHSSSLESGRAQNKGSPIIYVIDGDEHIHQSLRYLCHATGYQVKMFDSIPEFLAFYNNGHGCLILNRNLTGADALQFVLTLRNAGITLPVVRSMSRPDQGNSLLQAAGGYLRTMVGNNGIFHQSGYG
jgi:hypothetical protein